MAQTLKALSDPTRLSVFDMLMEGVQCNCEIAERLGLSLSLISHHLRILRQVGLVQSERDPEDARWVYHSIDQEALAELNRAVNHLLDVSRIQPR
ncbi:MAG: metalloregulator ArsR/SmtB family transcription factor, partial [Anaerolineae bacterium]